MRRKLEDNYFSSFNYSLANEDTRSELSCLGDATSILTVGGSGSRTLPLFGLKVKKIHVVDLSQFQLDYLKFKIELIRSLEHREYLQVLGFENAGPATRSKLLERASLSPTSERFLKSFDGAHLSNGFIYLGRWERFFLKLSKVFRFALGVDFRPLFEAKTLDDQVAVFHRIWPAKRFRRIGGILTHPLLMNALLYRGRFQHSVPLDQFLAERLEWYLTHQPVRESFFLQFLLLGKVQFQEGFPLDATRATFDRVRDFRGELILEAKSFNEALKTSEADFF